MNQPNIRDSRIPCPNCKRGTLYWNSEEKIYVCTQCGIQEAALKTWVNAGVHRQKKREQKKANERQWALNILGMEDKLAKHKRTEAEQEWDEIVELIKKKKEKIK
jgi:hypothetical protein